MMYFPCLHLAPFRNRAGRRIGCRSRKSSGKGCYSVPDSMRGVLAVLVCLLALQTSTGVSARFLLDLRSLPLHGRHLTADFRGEDPIGADTRGKDPIGADTRGDGASTSAASLASAQPSPTQAPTVAIAEAPAFAARPQVTAPAAPMPQDSSASLQAQTQGNAPTSAPAGESAPSAPAVPTLETVLGRRLAEQSQGAGLEGTGASPQAISSDPYSHSIFRQPRDAPVSAQSSAGGPIPLSTILFAQVPRPRKPTLATAPTTAPGGTEAPTASE